MRPFDSWPGMDLSYHYSSGPQLALSFRLDASRYDAAADTMWREQAERDAETYGALRDQWQQLASGKPEEAGFLASLRSTLHPDAELVFEQKEHSRLSDFLQTICTYLSAVAAGGEAVAPDALVLTWNVEQAPRNPAALFELLVTLVQEFRTPAEEGEEPVEIRAMTSEVQVLPALRSGPSDAEDTERRFVQAFAEAFPATDREALLPAIGGLLSGDAEEAPAGLWVVNKTTGPRQDSWLQIGALPLIQLLPPWALQPISGSVALPHYETGVGLTDRQTMKSFAGIDLNSWVDQFLRSVDAFIDMYSAPAAAIDALEGGDGLLDKLLAIRERLTDHLAAALEPVYADAAPAPEARRAAQATFCLHLPEHFSATVITYPFTGGSTSPARLFAVLQDPIANGSVEPREFRLRPAPGENYLSVIATAAPGGHRAVPPLSLQLAITHIGFATVPDSQGKETVSWLRLLAPPSTPAAAATPLQYNLPPVELPLPHRSFPVPPVLQQQEAVGTVVPAHSVADAIAWTYAISYQYDPAAQDRLYGTLTLNATPEKTAVMAQGAPGDVFFEALARFTNCRLLIQPDLEAFLAKVDADATDPALLRAAKAALSAFVELAAGVEAAWPSERQAGQEHAPADGGTEYPFSLIESEDADGSLRITVQQAEGAPPMRVKLPGYEGRTLSDSPNSWIFHDGTEALSFEKARPLPRRLEWPGLNVVDHRNAVATLQVRRNEVLAGRAVNPAFVSASPAVRFEHPAVPMLESLHSIDVAAWMQGQGPWPLETILDQFFKALLPAGFESQLMRFRCAYRYPLSAEGWMPDVELPVLLLPSWSFSEGADFAPAGGCSAALAGPAPVPVVCLISQSIRDWSACQAPGGLPGKFVLELTLFSEAAGMKTPLARLPELILPLTQISGLER